MGPQAMLWLQLMGSAAIAACAFFESLDQVGPILLVVGMVIFWRTVAASAQPFKAGWLWGSLVSFSALRWLLSYIELAWWNIPATLMLSLMMGAQWGLLSLLSRRINAVWLAAPTLGLTWSLLEWSREHWPLGGLSLGSFSMCAYHYPQICDLASCMGHWAIGGWLVTLSILLAHPKRKLLICLWLLIIPAYGFMLRMWEAADSDSQHQSFKVAMLQTGIYPLVAGENRHINQESLMAVDELMAASKIFQTNSFLDLDALIMPESVVHIGLDSKIVDTEGNTIVMRDIWHRWAKFMRVPLILGASWQEGGNSYCGSALIRPDGTEQRYAKTKLLPVAETDLKICQYLPKAWRPLKGHTAGSGIAIWQLGENVAVAPGVCYEETFATLARARRLAGAQLLIFNNNDGWYPGSSLYRHHYMHGMLRAIECGCPVAQCGSTGFTGAWSPRGVEVIPAPQGDSINLITGIIPISLHWTPFLEWGIGGMWGAWLLLSLATYMQLMLHQGQRQRLRDPVTMH